MAAIDPIFNGESGPAVRDKLNKLIDTVNSGSTTINVGDAPLFDPDKAGGYEAGSIISYKNESSPDEEFHEFAIYIALTDIPQGVSPEDSPNWKNEGATVEVAGGNTANGVVQDITRLRELTGMRTGHTVAVQAEGAIYVFDEGSEAGIKPFAPGIGSWVKRYEFSEMGGGHTILDPAGDAMPTQPALQFGAGFTVTDEEGKTVVDNTAASHIDGADEEKHTGNQVGVFSESIAFVSGAMTFDKNKYIQSHQITDTFQFTKSAGTHYVGAIIEACLIADGVTGHKPTFSADFNVQYDNWDNTNGAKNLVRMRYLPEGILTEIRKI